MNGPLRRLANRLAGSTQPRVQAMTRLPYGPTPDLLMPEETPSVAARQASTVPAGALAPPVNAPAMTSFDLPSAVPRKAAVARPDADAETGGRSDRRPSTPPLPRAPGEHERQPPGAPQTGRPPEPGSAAVVPPRDTLAATADGTMRSDEPERPAADERPLAAPRLLEPREHDPAASALPTPLVDALFTPATQPARASLGPAPGRAKTRGTATHAPTDTAAEEVHVHIGRIEVTAVQERPTTPPARNKRRGREPMALDEYLAKRQRER